MGKVNFEEVESFEVPGALNGEKIELPSDSFEGSFTHVTEHIYIIFSESISIKKGIKAIEDKVLSGKRLDIRRQDETGHGIVAVVSRGERIEIEKLSEVAGLKIEKAANTL